MNNEFYKGDKVTHTMSGLKGVCTDISANSHEYFYDFEYEDGTSVFNSSGVNHIKGHVGKDEILQEYLSNKSVSNIALKEKVIHFDYKDNSSYTYCCISREDGYFCVIDGGDLSLSAMKDLVEISERIKTLGM